MTFQEYLASMNIDAGTLSDARRTALETAWRSEMNPTPRPPVEEEDEEEFESPVAELASKAKARLARQQAITQIADEYMDRYPNKIDEIQKIADRAFQLGWDGDRTGVELVRQIDRAHFDSRTVSQSQNQSQVPVTKELLEAGLAIKFANSNKDILKSYKPELLQRAEDAFGQRGLFLLDMIGQVASRSGWRGQNVRNDFDNVMAHLRYGTAQFGGGGSRLMSGAVPSTMIVGEILSNLANKTLANYFNGATQVWRSFCGIKPLRNWHTNKIASKITKAKFEPLPKGGTIKHGTIGNESYEATLVRYAIQLGIDQIDIDNDDLGAFDSNASDVANGALERLEDEVHSVLLVDDDTFFAADNTGSADAGTLAGIAAASVKWDAMQGPTGKPLNIDPSIVLVGSDKYDDAWKNLVSGNLIGGSTQTGSDNPYRGRFTVVKDKYITLASYGGSAGKWFMFADPARCPAILVTFKDGVETPRVETGNLQWDMDGISTKGIFAFGVDLHERRVVQRNN